MSVLEIVEKDHLIKYESVLNSSWVHLYPHCNTVDIPFQDIMKALTRALVH